MFMYVLHKQVQGLELGQAGCTEWDVMLAALGIGLETKDTREEHTGVSLKGQEVHLRMRCVLGKAASCGEHST